MGAALTYARRYALFALVGIAGEDDLDAPDLNAREPTRLNKMPPSNGERRSTKKHWPQKKMQTKRGPNDDTNANSRLKAQLSGVLRDQLMGKLNGVKSAEEAALWARHTLRAKNALNSADARQIEEAFQARLEVVQGADEPDGHASFLSGPDAGREDGPFRKFRRASIDKSHLRHPEQRRVRDRDHVRLVANQPCLICGRQPADAHHLRFVQHRAMGRKVSDEFTVPLCRGHHREVHRSGNEAAWWTKAGVDPTVTARSLWLETHPLRTSANQNDNEDASSTIAVSADQQNAEGPHPMSKSGSDRKTMPNVAAGTQ